MRQFSIGKEPTVEIYRRYFGFWEKFEDSMKSVLIIKGTKRLTLITDIGNVIPRTDLAIEFYNVGGEK